ncbi:D-alanyl-D-alanine carboxypeptidase, serine-type, PBP4 family [Frankia canadensis]|uniref:D-alanyl-D-alanine carboxypeptidase, serine-type, PBP4 family n=1 Tax=Frankia canadensis TaxID=1836972 RepID=A0A2I2KMN4_9ACTN|nr:D-alanyl-D-alanine carboxypeptidase/D-alanyl-D-alanine-endopeptidase [Frankia canadensis]SNQ46924.1 D-alanyl-D-alanine carboxypeptidase, serine-type, PBP4 family [Frankia canadensis]SOU54214.1 D-alanyl-D-alanine carboxypeptidase, serine-type, PBP4 family [Frankia canadensis]
MISAAPVARLGGLTALAGALFAGSLAPVPAAGADAGPGGAAGRPGVVALAGLDPAAPAPDPAAVATRLAGTLGDPVLAGPAAFVVDASSGRVLLDQRGRVPATPASTLKTVVATAALATFPDDRLRTTVVHSPPPGGSATAPGGTLWLVGGGDPTLTAAPRGGGYPALSRLADLAGQVRAAGIRSVGQVLGDASLFVGPDRAPGWRDNYVTDGDVAPVSALAVDAGRSAPGAIGPRAPAPPAAAAAAFAGALTAAGVQVGSIGLGRADPSAREVAAVRSPPVRVLVEKMLSESDNDLAESLGRLVAHRRGLPASFAGATRAVTDTVAGLGIPTAGMTLYDVSGLSTGDLIPPATLVALLRAAVTAVRPELRTLLTGLPVAGFSGTLDDRYGTSDTAAGAGEVRAKTGTLRNVSSLAGQVVDADGRLLLFAFLSPAQEATGTKAALDRVAAALAGCGCRAAPTAPAAGRAATAR